MKKCWQGTDGFLTLASLGKMSVTSVIIFHLLRNKLVFKFTLEIFLFFVVFKINRRVVAGYIILFCRHSNIY